jgi:hypothetical protein
MPMYSVPSTANDGSTIRRLVDYLAGRVGSAPPPKQIDPQLDMDAIARPMMPQRSAMDDMPGSGPLLATAPNQGMTGKPDEFSSSDFRAKRPASKKPAAKAPARKPAGNLYGLD